MSKFSRSSSWLKQLFTPSTTGWREPGELASDVSLVQPYDGGGYPIQDPGQWMTKVTTAAVAVDTTVILTLGDNEIGRILGASVNRNLGVKPSCSLQIFDQNGNSLVVSDRILIAVNGEREGFQIFSPIIGPGHSIRGRHFGGDAATVLEWLVYVVRAPLGSVFYV